MRSIVSTSACRATTRQCFSIFDGCSALLNLAPLCAGRGRREAPGEGRGNAHATIAEFLGRATIVRFGPTRGVSDSDETVPGPSPEAFGFDLSPRRAGRGLYLAGLAPWILSPPPTIPVPTMSSP